MLALLCLPLVVVAHELAHAIVGVLLGGRAVRLRWIRWGAAVEAHFDDDEQRIAFLLAGPVASAAFGLILVAMGGWWALVGAVSILFGLLTLAGSDGRQAWALRRALARSDTKSNDPR